MKAFPARFDGRRFFQDFPPDGISELNELERQFHALAEAYEKYQRKEYKFSENTIEALGKKYKISLTATEAEFNNHYGLLIERLEESRRKMKVIRELPRQLQQDLNEIFDKAIGTRETLLSDIRSHLNDGYQKRLGELALAQKRTARQGVRPGN